MKNDNKKENKVGFIVLALSAIICLIAVSYAIWAQIHQGTKENKMDTATLILTLDESDSNGISLINTVPMSDEKGSSLSPYKFTIKNSGTTDANYRILLVNDTEKYEEHGCSNQKLNWSNIKYSIAKESETSTKGVLDTTGGVLGTGTLKAGKNVSYDLRLWIKSEATNEIMNQHFHGVIKVEAIQSDQSLPN